MRRLPLSIAGIALEILLSVSTVLASPELRDVPHKSGQGNATSPAQRRGPIIVVKPDGSGDVATIRDALLVALPGDTILLGPGTYRGMGSRHLSADENLPVTIKSMAGADQTIIDGEGSAAGWFFGYRVSAAEASRDSVSGAPTYERWPVDRRSFRSSSANVNRKTPRVLQPNAAQESVARPDGWGPYYSVRGVTFKNFDDYAIQSSDVQVEVSDCIVHDCRRGLTDLEFGGFAITNCVFENNVDAISAYGVTAENCMVRDNTFGITFGDGAIRRCTVIDNLQGIAGVDGYGDIVDNMIARNIGGGGLYLRDFFIRLNGNVIVGNHAQEGGAVSSDWGTFLEFRDNIIAGNSAERAGGALYGYFIGPGWRDSRYDPAILENNTIVGNSAPDGSVSYIWDGSLAFVRNIVAFNDGNTLFLHQYPDSKAATISGNNFYGNNGAPLAATTDAGDNTFADPWFCNLGSNVYTLQEGSPCLPENNPTGQLVGALGRGCDVVVSELKLSPNTIGVRSSGVVTATLGAVPDIDPATVRLNSQVSPQADQAGAAERRAQGNGRGALEYKFSTQELVAVLGANVPGETHTVTFTASLADGRVVRGASQIRISPAVEEPPSQQVVVAGDILVGAVRYGHGGVLTLVRAEDGKQFALAGPEAALVFGGLAFRGNNLLILASQKRILEQSSPNTEAVVLCPEVPLPRPSYMAGNKNIVVVANAGDCHDIIGVDPNTGEASVLYTSDFLLRARDVAVTSDGIVYVAHATTYEDGSGIVRIDPRTGERTFVVGDFKRLRALALDKDDNLFASDEWRHTIYRIHSDGTKDAVVSGGALYHPTRFAVEDDGQFIAATQGKRLVKASADGTAVEILADFDVDDIYDVVIVPPGGFHGRLGKGEPGLSASFVAAPARVVKPGIATVTPNPFNPVTTIRFGVVHGGTVDLVVYDVAGRLVARVANESMAAGDHDVTWDAGGVASGVYFARLTTPDGTFTRKLVVTK